MSIEAGNQPKPETVEQDLAHSGKLGLEKPVNTYKMPLDEAIAEDPNRAVAPNDARELNTPWYRRRATIIGGAVAGLLAAGLTVGSVIGGNAGPADKQTTASDTPNTDPDAEPVAPAPEAPAEEAPEAPAVDFDPSVSPPSVVEGNLFATLSPEAQQKVLTLDTIGIPEFRDLSREEELAFADYVIENNMPIVEYRLSPNEYSDADNSYIYKEANNETAQGVVNMNSLRYVALSQLKTRTPEAGSVYELDTALKASSILRGEDPNQVQNIDEIVTSWNINTPPTGVYKDATVTSEKFLEDGTWAINITTAEGNFHSRYTKETFTAYDGTVKEIYTPSLQVSEADPRYVSDLNNLT